VAAETKSSPELNPARSGAGQDLPSIVTPVPGPRSREMAAHLASLECPAFDARRDAREAESGADQGAIVYASGEGSNVVDVDGNRYVDLVAGFGALLLGHQPKEVAAAVDAQGKSLWLALGDVYGSDAKLRLLERLVALFPERGARVMLGLSGSDAVTAALKSAVLATGRSGVVAFEGGYHGLSHGPLAACGYSEGFRAPFADQLGQHVKFLSYPDSESAAVRTRSQLRAVLAEGNVGAVLLEPILGRGGCVVPPVRFLTDVRAACDERGVLLIADEIWTGLGRAGSFLATTDANVLPDFLCLGKGLGGGFPISACIGRASAMDGWGARGGSAIHTATHFGSPLACAAACAVLDALADGTLARRAADLGENWRDDLREKTRDRGVRDVRGRGLMVGVALEGGSARTQKIARRLLGRGYIVLTGGVGGDVLTLTPPLTVAAELLGSFTTALAEVLLSS
jgi:4-aminobutyrate aminotransferase-like enzyme